MDNSPEKYIGRMLEVSNKKYNILQDIFILTQSQAQSLSEDGMETLQKIINDKQKKLDEISKLDEGFNLYLKRLKQELKVESLDDIKNPNIPGVKELQQSIGKIVKLINDISDLEKQNNDRAQKLLKELGDEVKKLNQGQKVGLAYRPNPNVKGAPSYFIDKKK
jgi:hypothetical protein